MGTADRHGDAEDLDLFFAAARQDAPEASAAFLTRLAVQAEAVQAQAVRAAQAKAAPPVQAVQKRGLIAALAAGLGGWAALGGMAGGLATATVAGLWIGLAGAPVMLQAVGLGDAVQTAGTGEAAASYLADADIITLAMSE